MDAVAGYEGGGFGAEAGGAKRDGGKAPAERNAYLFGAEIAFGAYQYQGVCSRPVTVFQ
jgi:hypothetical protein